MMGSGATKAQTEEETKKAKWERAVGIHRNERMKVTFLISLFPILQKSKFGHQTCKSTKLFFFLTKPIIYVLIIIKNITE